jgi:hypothetical protein
MMMLFIHIHVHTNEDAPARHCQDILEAPGLWERLLKWLARTRWVLLQIVLAVLLIWEGAA